MASSTANTSSNSLSDPVKVNRHEIDFTRLRLAASEASGLLRLLANEDRLMLLCQLTHGEKNVSTLEALTGIHQPTLSQQLGVLRNEAVVSTRKEGKQVFYALHNKQVEAILLTLYSLFCPIPNDQEPNTIQEHV
jgi:DNA-binding transcriptional ArsR family regulator